VLEQPLPRARQAFSGSHVPLGHFSPLGQSASLPQAGYVIGSHVPLEQCWPLGQSVFWAQPGGSGFFGRHVWSSEHSLPSAHSVLSLHLSRHALPLQV
jgi:hypothetical protein